MTLPFAVPLTVTKVCFVFLVSIAPQFFTRFGQGSDSPEEAVAAWVQALENHDYAQAKKLGCWYRGNELGLLWCMTDEQTFPTYLKDFKKDRERLEYQTFFQKPEIQELSQIIQAYPAVMRKGQLRKTGFARAAYEYPRLVLSKSPDPSGSPQIREGQERNKIDLIQVEGRWFVYNFNSYAVGYERE